MISSRYYLDITHISSKYHPYIVQISPGRYFLQLPNLMKSRVWTQIWHDYCRKKTPLWNLIKTPLLIIQVLPKYHPNIIQKSSRNHPKIIQSTSIFTTPQLGEKSSFHPVIARLLQVNFPLLNSIKTPLLESKSRVLLDFNSSFCFLGATKYFLIYSFYHILSFSTVFVMLQNICSLNVQISV